MSTSSEKSTNLEIIPMVESRLSIMLLNDEPTTPGTTPQAMNNLSTGTNISGVTNAPAIADLCRAANHYSYSYVTCATTVTTAANLNYICTTITTTAANHSYSYAKNVLPFLFKDHIWKVITTARALWRMSSKYWKYLARYLAFEHEIMQKMSVFVSITTTSGEEISQVRALLWENKGRLELIFNT